MTSILDEKMASTKLTYWLVNPYDHRARDWGLFVEGRLPLVLGNDIAGIVDELGPGVDSEKVKTGDHVFGQSNFVKGSSEQCGLQEYALLDAYTTAKIPSNLTDDDGASLPCNLVAAFWAIFGAEGLKLPFPFPGQKSGMDYSKEKIVILGAGSNCGKYGVQICAMAGFGSIVAVADKKKNEETLKSYGATDVIDRHGSDVEKDIRAVVGDDLVYAFDAFNLDHTLGASILSSTKKGTVACLIPGKADESKIGEKKAGYADIFVSGKSHGQPELATVFWNNLSGWMHEGKIKATGWEVLKGLDADKVNKVLDDYRDNNWPPKQVHVHV